MKIYLDTCCYNRPYDDQKQTRIRAESVAVKNIIKLTQWRGYAIFGSTALNNEIGNIQNPTKHENVLRLYNQTITNNAKAKKYIFDHFAPLALQAGIDKPDVAHLCLSISAGVDYLLTTDDDFVEIASKLSIPIKVINPKNFPLGGMV